MASWDVRFFTFPLSFLWDCLLQHQVPAPVSSTNMAGASMPSTCCSLSPRVAKNLPLPFLLQFVSTQPVIMFQFNFNFICNCYPYQFSEVFKSNCCFSLFVYILFLSKFLVLVVHEFFSLLTVSVLSVSSGWWGGGCCCAVCCRAVFLRRGQG